MGAETSWNGGQLCIRIRWSRLPVIGGFALIFGAIFGVIKYVVKSEISDMAHNIETMTTTLQPLPEAINSLKDRTTKIETHWEDLNVRTLSQKPVSKETAVAVKQVLEEAKSASLTLPAETIRSAGLKFVDASRTSGDAWDAVIAFLEYRSYLSLVLNVVVDTNAKFLEAINYAVPK